MVLRLLTLPDELIFCVVLRLGNLSHLSRVMRTCRLLLRLCSEPTAWRSVTFVVPGNVASVGLQRGLRHTEHLQLRLASIARHPCTGRFCKSAKAAEGALTLPGCAGLSDAGVRAMLVPCERLRCLDLGGMAHLTGSTLAHVLSTFGSLEELTLRSCWQSASRSGWAEGLPEAHGLRALDLSHTLVDHLEILTLLVCTQRLQTLKLNFCEALQETGLRRRRVHSCGA